MREPVGVAVGFGMTGIAGLGVLHSLNYPPGIPPVTAYAVAAVFAFFCALGVIVIVHSWRRR